MSERENRRLSTWKEIAAFLDCDVRTCLRWEKERGLPVHRPEGGGKARVYAWTGELDTWLKGNGQNASGRPDIGPAPMIPPAARPGKMSPILIAAAVFALAGLVFFGYRILFFDRQPADFHIHGSILQIVNKDGKELWTFDTRLIKLDPEETYRLNFNRKNSEGEYRVLPVIIIRDIDGDGKKEVLFTPLPTDVEGAGRLYCFDFRGNLKWTPFQAGRELTFGNKTYFRDYWSNFDTLDLLGDEREEILVLSGQNPDWPSQAVLLSCEGEILGEYWNSGRFLDYAAVDGDGDGKKDLILCGTNNEYRRGFLAVFDPEHMAGSSPNTGEFDCPELAEGTEKAYILLPLTDIDPVEKGKDWLVYAVNIEFRQERFIYFVTLKNSLYFYFDAVSFTCRSVDFSNVFQALHELAVKEGRVSSVLDDTYLENLRTTAEYWTGAEWTMTPTLLR